MASSPEGGRLELVRSFHQDEVLAVRDTLEQAGIDCRVSSTEASFDPAAIGRMGEGVQAILSVKREDFDRATEVLEQSYEGTVLPEGHFLLDASDETLAEIIVDPQEWSAVDRFHAKRLARERGLDLEMLAKKRAELQDVKRLGKPAPLWLLVVGWVMSIFGGVFIGGGAVLMMLGLAGIGIGFSLTYMTEKSSVGDFLVYDKRSQEQGKGMMLVGLVAFVIWKGIYMWIMSEDWAA